MLFILLGFFCFLFLLLFHYLELIHWSQRILAKMFTINYIYCQQLKEAIVTFLYVFLKRNMFFGTSSFLVYCIDFSFILMAQVSWIFIDVHNCLYPLLFQNNFYLFSSCMVITEVRIILYIVKWSLIST